MFDESSNVQFAGENLKIHYPKISFIGGFEHTISLFFSDVSKIAVVNKMITAHKTIYNLFGSGIYHKPHSIFKSKSYEFHNRNIGLFSGNDTSMAGYFIWIHRYMCTRKSLLVSVSSAEFNTMSLKSNFYRVVSYIQDNKSWERSFLITFLLYLGLSYCI